MKLILCLFLSALMTERFGMVKAPDWMQSKATNFQVSTDLQALCLRRIELFQEEGKIATQRRAIEKQIIEHHVDNLEFQKAKHLANFFDVHSEVIGPG